MVYIYISSAGQIKTLSHEAINLPVYAVPPGEKILHVESPKHPKHWGMPHVNVKYVSFNMYSSLAQLGPRHLYLIIKLRLQLGIHTFPNLAALQFWIRNPNTRRVGIHHLHQLTHPKGSISEAQSPNPEAFELHLATHLVIQTCQQQKDSHTKEKKEHRQKLGSQHHRATLWFAP